MAQPHSLLAFLVAGTAPLPSTGFVWEQPVSRELPDRLREQLHHARLFSLLIHGAALLYNLMLAELAAAGGRADAPDLVEEYQGKLSWWAQEVEAETTVLRRWDWQTRSWEIVQAGNPRLHPRTRQFVKEWLRLVVPDRATAIADSPVARQLIRQRELRLKGKLARLANRSTNCTKNSPLPASSSSTWASGGSYNSPIISSILSGLSGLQSR
jgi:hypothetical protein